MSAAFTRLASVSGRAAFTRLARLTGFAGLAGSSSVSTFTCASAFAAVQAGLCPAGRPIEVVLDGGSLRVTVSAEGDLSMEGPAVTVFEGEVDL